MFFVLKNRFYLPASELSVVTRVRPSSPPVPALDLHRAWVSALGYHSSPVFVQVVPAILCGVFLRARGGGLLLAA